MNDLKKGLSGLKIFDLVSVILYLTWIIHESRLRQAPLRRAQRMWQFYLKQKVEIATLPSVARNDNLFKEKVVRFARPKGKRSRLIENGDCPFQSLF